MKRKRSEQTGKFMLELAGIRVDSREREALQSAVKVFNEQSQRLGLLDPLDVEPAILFFARKDTR